MTRPGALPGEILAIDWGATPAKRQLCRAVLRDGRYLITPPRPVPDTASFELASDTLAAFDCPIGLPHVYAAKAGLPSFRDALRAFGAGRFERFYDFAGVPAEIALERPFYPLKMIKGSRRDHLVAALGDAAFAPRVCDRQARAGPMFWLIGPRQVGRSAACVWREILTPRLEALALWPFDGALPELIGAGRPIVAEMYPAFLLRTLSVTVTSKSDGAARAACGRAVLQRLEADPRLDLGAVRDLLLSGFGPSRAGEDPFDATTACIALARLILDGAVPEAPHAARAVEGWILGLPAS